VLNERARWYCEVRARESENEILGEVDGKASSNANLEDQGLPDRNSEGGVIPSGSNTP
jgi:hypothetical protein